MIEHLLEIKFNFQISYISLCYTFFPTAENEGGDVFTSAYLSSTGVNHQDSYICYTWLGLTIGNMVYNYSLRVNDFNLECTY